ncbi:hypothetical protein LINPERPRIM_LOCUS32774 [Linum perenne]
MVKGKHQCI